MMFPRNAITISSNILLTLLPVIYLMSNHILHILYVTVKYGSVFCVVSGLLGLWLARAMGAVDGKYDEKSNVPPDATTPHILDRVA